LPVPGIEAIGRSRWELRPYPLRIHVKQAGADVKLIQNVPLGVAYHHRHPISTLPVARISAHATVPGNLSILVIYNGDFFLLIMFLFAKFQVSK
jgi:hypothetical protein